MSEKDYRSKINKTPEVEKAHSELSSLYVKQMFRHIKSGREYAFNGLKTAKFNGEWFEMVEYYLEADSIPRHKFLRTSLDFLKSFEVLEGQFAYN